MSGTPGEAGGPEVDGESSVTLVTMERLGELTPEHRRLVGLLVELLALDGASIAEALADLGAAASERRRRVAREIGRLQEGAELAQHQLVAAFLRLPVDERCGLRDLAEALADGEEEISVAIALRLVTTAGRRRREECAARRERILEEARRRQEERGEEPQS